MKRYHKDVFFEVGVLDEINALIKGMDLRPTKHFMQNWMERGNVCIPTKKIIQEGEIFEYYKNQGSIDRFAVRCFNISKDYDVVYVISSIGNLVTSWINDKNDLHAVLRKEAYEGGARDILPSERMDSTKGNEKSSRCKITFRKGKSKKHSSSRKNSWDWKKHVL